MSHMGANFHSQFKNKTLMKLFKRLCSQNQKRKFNFLWKKLDELTKKQTAELAKRPVNTEEDDQVLLEDVGLDGPNVRRKRRMTIKTFSKWIEHEPKEKWALLFNEGAARYGIMTTNLAEVYNWVRRRPGPAQPVAVGAPSRPSIPQRGGSIHGRESTGSGRGSPATVRRDGGGGGRRGSRDREVPVSRAKLEERGKRKK